MEGCLGSAGAICEQEAFNMCCTWCHTKLAHAKLHSTTSDLVEANTLGCSLRMQKVVKRSDAYWNDLVRAIMHFQNAEGNEAQ